MEASLSRMFVIIQVLMSLVECAVTMDFNCYSCTYTISGDPRVTYECADSPWNFTRGIPVLRCDDSRYCVTKTVYEKGYKKIKSVMRTCGTPETFGCGINCCQGSIYDDTCQYQCQGELCNGENEAKRIQTGSPGKPPGGSGTNLNITFTSICVFLLLYLFSVKFVIMRNILWT